jgi:hypothetical protein
VSRAGRGGGGVFAGGPSGQPEHAEYGPLISDPQPLGTGWWGIARVDGPTGALVEASNGTSYVHARARSLSVEELLELVTTLGPYDPASQPYLVAPPGTPVLGGEPPP